MTEYSKLKEFLQSVADNNTLFDKEDCIVGDVCGGNFEACYDSGLDDGEVSLAREILAEFFSEENDEPI